MKGGSGLRSSSILSSHYEKWFGCGGVGYHFLSSTSLREKGRREQEGNGSLPTYAKFKLHTLNK
jgi:hypothetical protein